MTITLIGFFSLPAYAEEYDFDEEEFDHEEHLPSQEEVLKWLEQYVPDALQALEELKKEMPEEYEEEIHMRAEMMMYLEELKATNPEMFNRMIEAEKLEYKTWKMAEEISQTRDDARKKQLTVELKTLLEKIFEIRLEERALEIQELEKELKEMKSLIEKRKAMKEKIIERHLQELISFEDETLEWW